MELSIFPSASSLLKQNCYKFKTRNKREREKEREREMAILLQKYKYSKDLCFKTKDFSFKMFFK